ncbi:MAG: ABC1 kinase family protein [Salinibacter sp.]|uniref:ABC1 kinase family protein n=1 Tax=Salinibacter sp. TaxID=2065818 RepID=UPI0035D4B974
MSSDDASEDFPASKLERSGLFAKTGLKVGKNYAEYLMDRATGADDPEARKRELNTQNARDLFKEFTRLRGTALKLAQSMSMDTGLLPDEFMDVMAEAQYSVPPMNKALVRKRIRDGLGRFPELLFDAFEPEAMAAASLGQVHRARLDDGRTVAVKVQYPNVRETIESDLAVARTLFERLVEGEDLDDHFEEVKARLQEETDYLNEAENIHHFADQYDGDKLVIPRPVHDLTSEMVLTMTYVEGQHLDAFLDTDPDQERRDHFGQRLWDFLHEQVASNARTLHADTHPGNFLFRDDGRLGVIDFGCVKTFPQPFRDDMLRLYRARMADDEDEITRLLYALDILRDDLPQDTQDELRQFFDRYGSLIVEPYRQSTFDFGAPGFRERLQDSFEAASQLRAATGSPHFIFLNKALVGLLNLLTRLDARVDTTGSVSLLNEALADLGCAPVGK